MGELGLEKRQFGSHAIAQQRKGLSMNFAVTPDEVRTVFGLAGVVFFPHYNAMHSRMNDRTAAPPEQRRVT
ncbi:hypothetical protein AB0M68_39315 [Streptomyces sp. NPDC051453]|uniref:hypothetical protein n=1 Tax=Streptomyces sp. NPDC051453 TaxID=3154941 RepID=UPI00342DC63D